MAAHPEHAVVTGGSSGIGRAVVHHLLDRGLRVSVLDTQPLAPAPTPYGSAPPSGYRVDVTRQDEVRDALDRAAREAGTPTRLVACHGVRGGFVPALELDLDAYRRVLDVHVVGTLVAARSLVALLREHSDGDALPPASVVTVASTTAHGGWRRQADYGVAKAGIVKLTQNLAVEWAPLGVRVNCVAPGHTRTPMVQEMVAQGYDTDAVRERTPLGRLAEPEETATAIGFLLLDATFTTGAVLPVDGGWSTVGS